MGGGEGGTNKHTHLPFFPTLNVVRNVWTFLAIAIMLARLVAAPAAAGSFERRQELLKGTRMIYPWVSTPECFDEGCAFVVVVDVVVQLLLLRREEWAPKRPEVERAVEDHDGDDEKKGAKSTWMYKRLAKLLRVKKFKFGKTVIWPLILEKWVFVYILGVTGQ